MTLDAGATIGRMTRVVGNCNRSEFILDPLRALQRGQIVDRMLQLASVPATRGITRAPHRVMNQLDDDRQVEAARRVNAR